MKNESQNKGKILRTALMSNCVFSTLSGISFIAFAESISEFASIEPVALVTVTGITLLLFAARLFHNAKRIEINLLEAKIAISMDFAWVLGTGALLALGLLNTGGNWGAAIIADIVLMLAIWQTIGLYRMTRRH